jgi:hypothetical protein
MLHCSQPTHVVAPLGQRIRVQVGLGPKVIEQLQFGGRKIFHCDVALQQGPQRPTSPALATKNLA